MVLDGKSLLNIKYLINVGVYQGSILVPKLFLLSVNDFPGDIICNAANYADNITLYS